MTITIDTTLAPVKGDWKRETIHPDYNGNGYIRWYGPNMYGKPGSGVLQYDINVTTATECRFNLRTSRRKDNRSPRDDEENDVFVKVNQGKWIKAYSPGPWSRWSSNLYFEHSHSDKRPARITLKAGPNTIYLSGRSEYFMIDQIEIDADGYYSDQKPPTPQPTQTPTPTTPTSDNFKYVNIYSGDEQPAGGKLPSDWTIEYVPTQSTKVVEFFIDGRFYRAEGVAPYIISGDVKGKMNPLTEDLPYGTVVSVKTDYGSDEFTVVENTTPTPTTPTPTPTPTPTTPIKKVTVKGGSNLYDTFEIDVETGYNLSESDAATFSDYRLTGVFTKGSKRVVSYGFFNGNGNPGDSESTSGTMWKILFRADDSGKWDFSLCLKKGANIGIEEETDFSSYDVQSSFNVESSNNTMPPVYYDGTHILKQADGKPFYKFGLDSPENFLGYYEFDSTPSKHYYKPHSGDYNSDGDEYLWSGGKGRNILGAINYMESAMINSQYMILMNVNGDGKDVYPWTSYNERKRFDISKLDQWFRVFSYMQKKGVMCHFLLQETENAKLLNEGSLGHERKLYYKEMVNRFSHFSRTLWNNCEESDPIASQQKSHINHLRKLLTLNQPIVTHSYPNGYNKVYGPLLSSDLSGISLQTNCEKAAPLVSEWLKRTDYKWIIGMDENNPHTTGVMTDASDFWHDEHRKVLWQTLLSGAYGMEYYYGYKEPHNDLTCEDFRSRDHWYKIVSYCCKLMSELSERHDLTKLMPVSRGKTFVLESDECEIYFCENDFSLRGFMNGMKYWWLNTATGERTSLKSDSDDKIPPFKDRECNSVLVLEKVTVPTTPTDPTPIPVEGDDVLICVKKGDRELYKFRVSEHKLELLL